VGSYDHVDHARLVAILAESIPDQRFLRLIKGLLDAGYMEDWRHRPTLSGVPQGGVLSPTLFNVYLDRLDRFITTDILPEYNRGKRRTPYRPYVRLAQQMTRLRQQGHRAAVAALRKQLQRLPARDPDDPGYRRLRYQRYADDWLLGFCGPRQEAEEIKQRIGDFLRDLCWPLPTSNRDWGGYEATRRSLLHVAASRRTVGMRGPYHAPLSRQGHSAGWVYTGGEEGPAMAYTPLAARRLTPQQEAFLRTMPDDTEEAPWMVMGSGQFWAAIRLAESLETYAQEEGLGWFVGGMLPILYREPGTGRRKQVAPDVLVAFVERRDRQSYALEEEGVFPAFVVEVASPDSVDHDDAAKRTLYDLLGAEEYALFAPGVAGVQETRLWGYRRGADGTLEDWAPDAAGRLWSTVLGLYLVVQGRQVRAADRDSRLLPTLRESQQARRQAEEEVERLRAALARRPDAAGQGPPQAPTEA
jgi:Uma2 family endonuclease